MQDTTIDLLHQILISGIRLILAFDLQGNPMGLAVRIAVEGVPDDLKAAATDCLKKCATLLGVGLHLYFDVRKAPNGSHANGNRFTPGNGHPHTENPEATASDSGRITARQLSAIFSLAKARGWSNKQIRDFAPEMFGKLPDFLNKTEASAVIQHLQGGNDA